MIYALVGKSCSGKSSAFHELLDIGYETVVSYTTRPMRSTETEGKEYQFITNEEFRELEESCLIVAPRKYNDWLYGMNLLSIYPDQNQIVIVDPQGLKDLIRDIGKNNVTSIYLASSNQIRLLRSRNRKDDPEETARRFGTDLEDFKDIEKEVDFIISSIYKDDALSSILKIIEKKL